eukprot:symbB.v1.2.012068.t1/scaffold825.1/size159525/9
MEFTVVTTSNLPPKPILAVHAGSVRRQMKLEVNHPFILPDPGSQTSVEARKGSMGATTAAVCFLKKHRPRWCRFLWASDEDLPCRLTDRRRICINWTLRLA